MLSSKGKTFRKIPMSPPLPPGSTKGITNHFLKSLPVFYASSNFCINAKDGPAPQALLPRLQFRLTTGLANSHHGTNSPWVSTASHNKHLLLLVALQAAWGSPAMCSSFSFRGQPRVRGQSQVWSACYVPSSIR